MPATIQEIAAKKGKRPEDVSANDLMAEGYSAGDAMRTVSEAASNMAASKPSGTPKPPATSPATNAISATSAPKTPGAGQTIMYGSAASNEPKPNDMFSTLEEVKGMAGGGDLEGAAQKLASATGISVEQARANVMGYSNGSNTSPNTSSKDGLWSGTYTSGNPSGAYQGYTQGYTTPESAQKALELTAQAQSPLQSGAKPVNVAPQTGIPRQSSQFTYTPSQQRSDQALLAAAKARAATMVGTRREEALAQIQRLENLINSRLAYLDSGASEAKKNLQRQQAGFEEQNRYRFGSRGLATSGFMAAANAQGQAATQNQMGQIDETKMLQEETLNNELLQANREYGSMMDRLAEFQSQAEVAGYEELQRLERDFGLRERAQLFNEFDSTRRFDESVSQAERDFGLREKDLNSILAQRAQELDFNAQMNPERLRGAQIGNDTAAFGLYSQQRLLPYELASRSLNLRTGEAAYNDQYTEGGLGYQQRALANESSRLQNQAAQLELQIAQDPDVGRKKQLQAQLQQTYAQIENIKAQTYRTYNPVKSGSSSTAGFGDIDQKTMQAGIDDLRADYGFTNRGAQAMWQIGQMMNLFGPMSEQANQQSAARWASDLSQANTQTWNPWEKQLWQQEYTDQRNQQVPAAANMGLAKLNQALQSGQIDSQDWRIGMAMLTARAKHPLDEKIDLLEQYKKWLPRKSQGTTEDEWGV